MASYPALMALSQSQQNARPDGGRLPPRRIVHLVRGRPGSDDRPALPSGHPDTWGLITAGTCIEGAPYPFPVFLR